jgi:alpha-beta hydrolase superfamily lysophospholipase
MSRIGQWRQEYDGIAEYVRGSDELNNEMAYLGLSFGASVGAFVLTFDDAIKSAVLLSGGYRFTSGTDIASFMKVQTPILMLNARYDYLVPMEQAQMFYDNVGTPEQDKRLVIYDTGHWPLPRHQMSREMIDWLDRYHGPIE